MFSTFDDNSFNNVWVHWQMANNYTTVSFVHITLYKTFIIHTILNGFEMQSLCKNLGLTFQKCTCAVNIMSH